MPMIELCMRHQIAPPENNPDIGFHRVPTEHIHFPPAEFDRPSDHGIADVENRTHAVGVDDAVATLALRHEDGSLSY